MKNSILLMFAMSCFAGLGHVQAAETAEQATPEDRTFALFQQYLQANDRQMAEVIAYGALGKFGAEHELVQKMRREVVKSAEGNVYLVKRFEFLPAPPTPPKFVGQVSIKTYYVGDVVTSSDFSINDATSLPRNFLVEQMTELGSIVSQYCGSNTTEEEFCLQPFSTNLTLVVRTTEQRHAQVAQYLKSRRETK